VYALKIVKQAELLRASSGGTVMHFPLTPLGEFTLNQGAILSTPAVIGEVGVLNTTLEGDDALLTQHNGKPGLASP
jgi:hypothetical protein